MSKRIITYAEVVVHCPNATCGKLVLKEALLIPGTHFRCRCPHCQTTIYVNAQLGLNGGELTVY